MGCLGLVILILVSLPLLFILIFFDVLSISLSKLGLTPELALILLCAMILGSVINIPLSRRRIVYEQNQPFYRRFFFYRPPQVSYQVVALNVGGALIPIGFAIYLLPKAPLLPTLIATAVLIIVTRLLSKPVKGVGITLPFLIPPLTSAGLAFLLAGENPAPVAYISGTVGTLIGADLLNWPNFKKLGAHLISIGGAGMFDGIFLSGIMAALITSF